MNQLNQRGNYLQFNIPFTISSSTTFSQILTPRYITADETNDNCDSACNECVVCRKNNPFYQNCYRSCDRCRYCKLQIDRYRTRDPPYAIRNTMLPDATLLPPVIRDDGTVVKIQPAPAKFTTSQVCGPVLEQEYNEVYNNYMKCVHCKKTGMCWSKEIGRCIDCDEGSLRTTCETKFGCPNPWNPMLPNIPPKNPLFTDCRACWRKQQ